MQNKLLLGIGVVLIILGIFKPSYTLSIFQPSCPTIGNYVVDEPVDGILLEKAQYIIEIMQSSKESTRYLDCLRLSTLYADIAILIELNDQDQVITNTAEIRQANILAGKMLRLNIQNKYPNLAKACQDLVYAAIGDNDVVLDSQLRSKAAAAFRALSWAFYESSK